MHQWTSFRWPWTPVPDEEYISATRRVLSFWDRIRLWMIFLYLGLLIGLGILLEKGANLLQALAAPPGNAQIRWDLLGFVFGAVVGCCMGGLLQKVVHGLTTSIGGFRSERLLLKYYDLYVGNERDNESESDAANPTL